MARRASSISSSNVRRSLAAAVIALLVAGAVVCAKFFFSYHLAPTTSGIGGLRDLADVDLLFIGSSHTRQGYSAEIMQKETGKSTYVLAYSGLDAAMIRELLIYLLDERDLKIGRVVIEAYSIGAVLAPGLKDTRLFNDAPPALKRGILAVLDREGMLDLRRLFELLVLAGNEPLLTAPVMNPLVINPGSFRGSYRGKSATGLSRETFLGLEQEIPPEVKADLDPQQRAAWEELLALVRQRHLDVVFVEVPMPATVTSTPVVAGARRQLSALLARHGFSYVDLSDEGRFDSRSPELFTDWNHLSSDGRALYSKAFVDWLRETSEETVSRHPEPPHDVLPARAK
jgi:hypothetical protein